jgi:mycofactocin precursor
VLAGDTAAGATRNPPRCGERVTSAPGTIFPRRRSTVTNDTTPITAADAEQAEETEEVLIEEISIDGMCGVY